MSPIKNKNAIFALPRREIESEIMPSNITVSVHVKPYIKKYLLHLSTNKAEPVIFPRKHYFVSALMPLLVSKSRFQILSIAEREYYPSTLETVDIMLPWSKNHSNNRPDISSKRYLSPASEREYRNFLELYWRMFASNQIIEKINEGNTRIDSIDMLMNEIAITEDDINKESLYRYYSRLMNVLC